MAFCYGQRTKGGSRIDARARRSRGAVQFESDQARGGLKGGEPISEDRLSAAGAGVNMLLAAMT
jgi:hypothetical protein